MKRYLVLVLISSLLFGGCVTGNEMRISMQFPVDFGSIQDEESRRNVERAYKALDDSAEYINNLRIQNKLKDIQINNYKAVVENSDIDRDKKIKGISTGTTIGSSIGCYIVGTIIGIIIGKKMMN